MHTPHDSDGLRRATRGRLAWTSALALFVALLVFVAAPVRADDDGLAQNHDVPGRPLLSAVPAGQRDRVKSLWAQIVCACPRENWSKSLLNCPDACADPQKSDVIAGVIADRKDDEILEAQRQLHGPRVLGKPDDAATYVLPFAVLAAAIAAGLWALRAGRSRGPLPSHGSSRPGEAEVDAIERELREIV